LLRFVHGRKRFLIIGFIINSMPPRKCKFCDHVHSSKRRLRLCETRGRFMKNPSKSPRGVGCVKENNVFQLRPRTLDLNYRERGL
jgi:hypothetical protein